MAAPLAPLVGETRSQLAARVLAHTLRDGVDLRELALDAWELPHAIDPRGVQIMRAYLLALERELPDLDHG